MSDTLSTISRTVAPMDKQWADSLRALPDYTYQEATSSRSLIQVLFDWFMDFLREVLDGRANSPTDWFTYLAILAAIGITIYLVRRDGASSPLTTRGRSLARVVTASDDLEIDLLAAMRDAERGGNYAAALRIVYLFALRELGKAGLITWRPDTSDSVYISQMRQHEHGAAFRSAVTVFRRVWYGGASIDAGSYQQARDQFLRSCGVEAQS